MNYLLFGIIGLGMLLLLVIGGWRLRAPRAATPAAHEAAPATQPPPALVVSTLAGAPRPDSYADGPGDQALFSRVGHMGFDGHGNLYVTGTAEIRKITPAGVVSTLVGAPPEHRVQLNDSYTAYGDYTGSVDGRGLAARLLSPASLAVALDGPLYAADQDNNCVRVIRPAGAGRG